MPTRKLDVGELQPNYLTIDPVTGQVSANFSGIVNALGLTLPVDESPAGIVGRAPNSVRWIRQASGACVAQTYVAETGAVIERDDTVQGNPGETRSMQHLIGPSMQDGSAQAFLWGTAQAGQVSSWFTTMTGAGGTFTRYLLNTFGGQSSFVQAMSQNTSSPRIQRMGLMSQASGFGSLAAGWQQLKTTSLDSDPDGLFAFNGIGYYLNPPEAGQYECTTVFGCTNGTGGILDFIAGFQTSSGGFNIPYVRDSSPNTANEALSITFTYTLSAGQWVTPAIWLSSVGGFGVTGFEGYFQAQRVG